MEQGKPLSTTDGPLVDYKAVCQKVRAAIEPARAHAVSLHDQHGDVLWLSESSMGPDEHDAVREAVEAFSSEDGPPVLVADLGDSRSAVLLRAVNGRRTMVGAIMVVMDARVVRQDARGALKVPTPKLQRALADFAAMRPGTPPATPARAGAAVPLTLVIDAPAPPPRTPPAAASRTPPAAASRTPPPPSPRTPPPATPPRRQPRAPRRRPPRAPRRRQPRAPRRRRPRARLPRPKCHR